MRFEDAAGRERRARAVRVPRDLVDQPTGAELAHDAEVERWVQLERDRYGGA